MPRGFVRAAEPHSGFPPPPISGTPGVWTNVTPGGVDLDSTHNSNDNAGVQDVLAHPTVPGLFYAFICYQGCWASSDYGLTWTKQSPAGGPLDFGKSWGSDIAPDGSYMLATLGSSAEGTPEGRRCIFKSTDAGVTWSRSADTGHDPYNVNICPFDKTQALACTHDDDSVLMSTDSGGTWSAAVDTATGGTGGYLSYLQDASHAIYVGQDSDDVYLLTKSGTWSSAAIATLANAGHGHGAYQGYRDAISGRYYHPSGSNTGEDGIWTSDDNGATFTQRYSASGESAIVATTSTLYSFFSFPNGNSGAAPHFTTSLRSSGTSWAANTAPSGMTNGAKRMAAGTDGAHWVILAGCWNGGIWRYVE